MPIAAIAAALTRNGTDGRVYGGDENLLHVADGRRRQLGQVVASYIEDRFRSGFWATSGRYTWSQLANQLLCPGCYRAVLFNAAVALAKANGQPLDELALSMEMAFNKLRVAGIGADGIEEIDVISGAE